MKMNNDDEWISMGQATKDINRALELDVELERCQELNAQGEGCLADNDIAKAEEYFNQAAEALDKIDSEISSLEISDLKVDEYRAQAGASLGLARCWARSVPEYTWRDDNRDQEVCNEWSDVEDVFEESLEYCEDIKGVEDEGVLELKACAMLGRATVRDRIFEYEARHGLSEYWDSGRERQWPDKEYEAVMQFLSPLVDKNPDRFEPILLDAMTAQARWKRLNCNITNNIAIFGAGEFDPEDQHKKLMESLDTLLEVIARRRKLEERASEKNRVALIDAVNEMVEHMSEGGPGSGRYATDLLIRQLVPLADDIRANIPFVRELAADKPTRYSELLKRTEKSLAKVIEILSQDDKELPSS